MPDEEILGTTTVTDRFRISLIVDVREELEELGHDVEVGDRIVYRRVGDKITVEPA